jgi:exonuclease-1
MGWHGGRRVLKCTASEKKLFYDFAGSTIGIDMSVWLHGIAVGIAEDLVVHKDYTSLVTEIDKRVRDLLLHGVHPVLVFDGAPFPGKMATNASRQGSRDAAYDRVMQAVKEGETAPKTDLVSAISITEDMVIAVISGVARARGLPYLVSPYEADHQLVFLARIGLIEYIMTIDSDLVCT